MSNRPAPVPLPAPHPDWKAPAGEGGILIWPEPPKLMADIFQNHRELKTSQALVQNVPLAELRHRARQALTTRNDALIIASGHQTELYHAGVWAKDALASAVTARMANDGGQAWHFCVDTDQPKHLVLHWPGGAGPITDDPGMSSAAWSGLIRNPSWMHLNRLIRKIDDASRSWRFLPEVGEVLLNLRHLLDEKFAVENLSLGESITLAMEVLDETLGLTHQMRLVSPLLMTAPYLVLVHHWLARAGQLADQYNRALADYRRAAGIRSSMRPMPDLNVEADPAICEVPFWLDDLATGTRRRADVSKINGEWNLCAAGGERFALSESADGWKGAEKLAQFLSSHHLRLSPRALTLTLYFRLLLVDQFIHGIGGARYDQVTDALIAEHFGITPPKFCVTTATLYFPTAAGRTRVDLPRLEHEGHQLKHRSLGTEKLKMTAKITALPRRSSQRRAEFAQMQIRLAAATVDNPALADWENRLVLAKVQARAEAALFDRELFYAFQSRERLLGLMADYQSRFASVNDEYKAPNQ